MNNLEQTQYEKRIKDCCYLVLDQLPQRTYGRRYREIVGATASSMGLQHSKHIVYWILEDSGSVAYWRSDRRLQEVSGDEPLLSLCYDGLYHCPTTHRKMVILSEARKCKEPTEDEIKQLTEKFRGRIELAVEHEKALRLHEEGKTGPDIARELGRSYSTIRAWLRNENPLN